KTVHGSKEAWHALTGRGLALDGVVFDTLLASYLCYPDQRSFELGDLSVRHLHRELRAEEAPDDAAQGALDLDLEDSSETRRTGLRAAAVAELTEILGEQLADRESQHLLSDLELPLVGV